MQSDTSKHLPSAPVRSLLCVALVTLSGAICQAGVVNYSIPVPASPFPKDGAAGWGALVLVFDAPITGGSFIFDPFCPTPTDGVLKPDGTAIQFVPITPADPNADPPTPARTQRYALQPTGTEAIEGPPLVNYGPLKITLNFAGNNLPNITQAFWKSKPGNPFSEPPTTSFTLDGTGIAPGAGPDLLVTVPEPGSLALASFALAGLVALRRSRRAA